MTNKTELSKIQITKYPIAIKIISGNGEVTECMRITDKQFIKIRNILLKQELKK